MENNIFNLVQESISKLEESNPKMKGFFERALAGEFEDEKNLVDFLKGAYPENDKDIDKLTKSEDFKKHLESMKTRANMFKNIVG